MGVNITVFAEAKTGKKGKPYRYIEELEADRNYYMFTAMGYELVDFKPLYEAKGLPGDVTKGVYLEYNKYDCFHTPSWLTAQELLDCITFCENILDDESYLELFVSYRKNYEILKEYDNRGEPSRIVFWFD